eukprot:2076866-Amphidinium_carterae.1
MARLIGTRAGSTNWDGHALTTNRHWCHSLSSGHVLRPWSSCQRSSLRAGALSAIGVWRMYPPTKCQPYENVRTGPMS